MTFTTRDPQHPRLERGEAFQLLTEKGFVRMDGHTATNEAQLEQLYDVIFAAKDQGEYGQAQGGRDARAAFVAAGGTSEVFTEPSASASSAKEVKKLAAALEAANQEIASLKGNSASE